MLVTKCGYTRRALADPLKELAYILNPWVRAYSCHLAELVDEKGWDNAKAYPEVRQYLQILGTEGCRTVLGPDVWARALETYIHVHGLVDVVVPDVRFDNEAAMCDYVIEVVAPWTDTADPHVSEAGVSIVDWTFHNTGSISDLEKKVLPLMQTLKA